MASGLQEGRVLERIDPRRVPDAPAESTPGEAMAGMIRTGWGGGNRPLSLPPQFFATHPRARLCREGVHAERCNRCPLGRPREAVAADGGALLVRARARAVCGQDGSDQRVTPLAPTSVSVSGASGPERAEHARPLTYGAAKAHRPDVQQAGWALRVCPDGGGPGGSHRWDGHASETKRVQERAAALLATVQRSPPPRSLVADANRSQAAPAAPLTQLGCITRLPHTLTVVSQGVTPARHGNMWERLDATPREHRSEWWPSGRAQRGRVVASQAALARAAAPVSQAGQRASEALQKPRWQLHAPRFEPPEGAHAALAARENPWTSPQGEGDTLIDRPPDAHPGRPTHPPPIPSRAWQLHAQSRAAHQPRESPQPQSACGVVGRHIAASQVSEPAVLAADTGQAQAEGGWRFLKEPRGGVSSWCVNQPCRRQGLRRVMTCARLVSAVPQRRRRHPLAHQGETVPTHIPQPTAPATSLFRRGSPLEPAGHGRRDVGR
jgi:hypothetical protein